MKNKIFQKFVVHRKEVVSKEGGTMEKKWVPTIFCILNQIVKSSSISQLVQSTDSFIDDLDFVRGLLEDADVDVEDDLLAKEDTKYPLKPFYKRFSRNLYKLCFGGWLSLQEKSLKLGLSSKNHLFKKSTLAILQRIADEEITSNGVLNVSFLENLLYDLRKSDVLILLGVGRTEGSLDVLPPDVSLLWKSFRMVHHPKSKLTVGARALTKHCHRSSEQFWGVCTGTEEKKNKHSMGILCQVFADCCWLNVHTLPHRVFVLEVRNSSGYGLRWSHDGRMFRGFLEPQMENGHEVGWRH